MKNHFIILIVILIGILSCNQETHSLIDLIKSKTLKKNELECVQSQIDLVDINDEFTFSKYYYLNSDGQQIIIENSLPKGGFLKNIPYSDRRFYAVFWTQIINETDNSIKLTFRIPNKDFELYSSPGTFFNLFISNDTINTEMKYQFNYGLDIENLIESNRNQKLEINKIIYPKTSSSLFLISLFNHGVNGPIRTELKFDNCKLNYRVNELEINVGFLKTPTI